VTKQTPGRIKWTYKLLAVSLPFIALFLLEVILRIAGYGYTTDLFVEDDSGRYYLLNPGISKKYFMIEENATIGNHEYFSKKKSQGTKRFFVLGASSAIGYPYMHNGSFSRMLKYRLQFAFPNTNLEMINLSLTAINTCTLYDFSKKLIRYEPDAILIYAGHNEYYGALGAASTSTVGRNPVWIRATLAMKELKLMQGVFHLAATWKGVDKRTIDANRTLMERMTEEQSIPYQSTLFRQGIEQFDRNMGDMLHLFTTHHIPVFISTLVYNQRDLKPFISSSGSLSASLQYEKGHEAYSRGDYALAKEYYSRAKEYDELRFRAPEQINDLIRHYAQSRDQVHLVDALKTFETCSPHGILDSTLLLEHVHPNLYGQGLIADAFYNVITSTQVLSGNGEKPLTSFDYPYTVHDSIFGQFAVHFLKKQWPFNEPATRDTLIPATYEEQIALARINNQLTWYESMRRLYSYYAKREDKVHALRILEGLYLEYPYDAEYVELAANLSLLLGEEEKAQFYSLKLRAPSVSN
jgi:hypothetical protein